MFYTTIAVLSIACAIIIESLPTKYIKPKSYGRLNSGYFAEHGQFPYAAILQLKNNPTWQPPCGGAIISDRHILTEAWCMDYDDTVALVGCENYNSRNCTEYVIEKVDIHPVYAGIGQADLAILTVVGNIAMTSFVDIISISPLHIEENTSATVLGWNQDLLWMEVMVYSSKECRDDWGHNEEEVVCTKPAGVVGYGDYGCPLVVNGSLVGFPILQGYHSDFHQRVSPYVDWINFIIGSNV